MALTRSFDLAGDGKCVVCDSLVRPCTLVRICDECNYGSFAGRCVICGGVGISDAFYCRECTQLEKDVSLTAHASPSTAICLHLCAIATALTKPLAPVVGPVLAQRDGCPKIVNVGSAVTDLFYERKKYGFKKR